MSVIMIIMSLSTISLPLQPALMPVTGVRTIPPPRPTATNRPPAATVTRARPDTCIVRQTGRVQVG